MSKRIDSIEKNPFKNKARQAIVAQAKEWGWPIDAATLPAEHWLFEKALLAECNVEYLLGYEIDPETYRASEKNIPQKKGVDIGLINRRITGIYDAEHDDIHNFAWFDYCGPAHGGNKFGFSRIEEPAAFIRALIDKKMDGLCYVTYCMTARHLSIEEMAKAIWGGNLSLAGAIKRRLWSEIGQTAGDGVHLVMEIAYLGGKDEKTPMLTLGFQVGKLTVTPFNADWSVEVKEARQAAHAEKYGGNYVSPEQQAKVDAIFAEAKIEVERIQEIQKSLRIINLSNKELIAYAHKQGLSTAAIHRLFGQGEWTTPAIPILAAAARCNTYDRRSITRRNVGATVAWL